MARGFSTAFDTPSATIDGVTFDTLWAEYVETLAMVNQRRAAVSSLFTFDTTLASDEVFQSGATDDFEEASEFGVPMSIRGEVTSTKMGFPLRWFDKATRYTWKFLRDATADQVRGVHSLALEADNRLLYKGVMSALLSNVNRTNEDGVTVYSLWNGTDGQTPPNFGFKTFDSSHSHYVVSGNATIDSTDVEAQIRTITEHGYGINGGERVILLVNEQEAVEIGKFRANVTNNNAAVANYDFIPSEAAPAYLTSETLVGERPPASFEGLKVIGSYANALIVQEYLVPAGYVIAVATSGAGSVRNPLAFREHARVEYRGLRQIPGPNPAYPIAESYYSRGFGVGVRHRGAAAVTQIKASGTYDVPSL